MQRSPFHRLARTLSGGPPLAPTLVTWIFPPCCSHVDLEPYAGTGGRSVFPLWLKVVFPPHFPPPFLRFLFLEIFEAHPYRQVGFHFMARSFPPSCPLQFIFPAAFVSPFLSRGYLACARLFSLVVISCCRGPVTSVHTPYSVPCRVSRFFPLPVEGCELFRPPLVNGGNVKVS